MDARLILAVVLVAAVAVGAGVALHHGSTSQEAGNTSNQEGSGGAGQGGSASGGATASLEGTWTGTYTGAHGSGEWTWKIRETSPGHYEGCLRTTGTYSTPGWVPVTITVSGDKITIGATGGVVFQGTISGSSASGTWAMQGGVDSGTWKGHRSGPAGGLPCTVPGEPGAGGNETNTSTGPGGGASLCTPHPPSSVEHEFRLAMQAVESALQSGELHCFYEQSGSGKYGVVYNITGSVDALSLAHAVADNLASEGWKNISTMGMGVQSVVAADMGWRVTLRISINAAPGGGTLIVGIEYSP